jgi:predicted ATP-dependent Lon-type protease
VSDGIPPTRDALDNKANQLFAGKVVRKDLVRKVKVGANVPVFVLEFLLGKYCASSDEVAIQMGLQVVNDTLAKSLTQKPTREPRRLMANWMAAKVMKAASVSARFS